MTTVEREILGSAAAGTSSGARAKGVGRRVWQVPLLLAGVALFGFGIRSLVRAIKPVPFETQVKDIRELLKAGENLRAIEQVNAMGNYYAERSQQAQLQWLAGDAHYLSQVKQGTFVGENYARVLEHYRKAAALGAQPTAMMNERWGLAALALGEGKLAIEKLEAAVGEDPEKLLSHTRELVAAYLMMGNAGKAQGVVDRVLASESKSLSVDDRAWGYCKKIEMALEARRGGAGGEGLDQALAKGEQAVNGMPERDPSGRILLWIGRAEVEEAKLAAARQHLEAARGRFIVHHLEDGRAAVLLGKVALAQGRFEEAGKLFQEVVMGWAGSSVWAAARFGRAEVLSAKGTAGEQMEGDYRFVMKALGETRNTKHETRNAGEYGNAETGRAAVEMVNLDQVRTSLVGGYERFAAKDQMEQALRFLAMLGELKEKQTAGVAYAWATTRERRAEQIKIENEKLKMEKGGATRQAEARLLLKRSAEDYLRHAKLATMEDGASGNSVWKAAQLFDQAGETMRSIEVYERFTVERPRDPRVPEAMLAIGRLYQSVGMYDKAIAVYQRNMEQNAKTPAAYTSAVNLARCYMMQGAEAGGVEEQFKKAEKALLSLVHDNGNILPTANEYRMSLFTLGELYYRNEKWADAILRLEEAIERYPEDAGVPRGLFMLAQTYRKSAGEIGDALKKEEAGERKEALAQARRERLERAAELFERVIGLLDAEVGDPRSQEPVPGSQKEAGRTVEAAGLKAGGLSALAGEYLRTSYMDRAECSFSLLEYGAAIKLYDAAATRFSQDVTAVEAYVQIVNAYQAMKQPAQASAAAERARWVLKRIPEEAFGKGAVKLTREYYEELLKLAKGT